MASACYFCLYCYFLLIQNIHKSLSLSDLLCCRCYIVANRMFSNKNIPFSFYCNKKGAHSCFQSRRRSCSLQLPPGASCSAKIRGRIGFLAERHPDSYHSTRPPSARLVRCKYMLIGLVRILRESDWLPVLTCLSCTIPFSFMQLMSSPQPPGPAETSKICVFAEPG